MNPQKANNSNHFITWSKWKEEGDVDAKNSLIEIYLPLVDRVIKKLSIFFPKHVLKDDLRSYGTIGLIDAVEKFDYKKGLLFETYASWRIRGAIYDGVRKEDWVPRIIREKLKKIEAAYQVLEQSYNRPVSDLEVCSFLNLSIEEFRKTIQELNLISVCSIDDLIDDEKTTIKQFIVDENSINPITQIDQMFLKETLTEAIEHLTNKERNVITLFYFEELTVSEIAEVMNLTLSRISQLHSKALLRLRGILADRKMQLYQ